MNEKTLTIKNFIFSVLLMLLFISFSVVVTLNFRQLYYFDMDYLDIPAASGLEKSVVRENYDALIDYNSMFYRGELEFPTLPMSESGKIHFEEVKDIFVGFQKLFIADLLVCAVLLVWHIRKKSFAFLKLAGSVTVLIPAVLGVLIALNWDWCFVTFHHLAFDNDYWIFDAATDPVITILPDSFFMHCALMILGIVLFCAALCFVAGKIQKRSFFGA
ncbi:MAG: TIGR01906 family membrane protein [Lachnospiraceae bacterium]|nr:TIGR01906 family membrane protein [Lachnospiraceae bacterium]